MTSNGFGREYPAKVHQAQGIVSVQADCGMDEALRRIIERAKRLGLTLEDTAADVVGRRIWFTAEDGP